MAQDPDELHRECTRLCTRTQFVVQEVQKQLFCPEEKRGFITDADRGGAGNGEANYEAGGGEGCMFQGLRCLLSFCETVPYVVRASTG
jgi:hypothetical protein